MNWTIANHYAELEEVLRDGAAPDHDTFLHLDELDDDVLYPRVIDCE